MVSCVEINSVWLSLVIFAFLGFGCGLILGVRLGINRPTKRAADGATWDSLGAGNDDNEPNQAYGADE